MSAPIRQLEKLKRNVHSLKADRRDRFEESSGSLHVIVWQTRRLGGTFPVAIRPGLRLIGPKIDMN